MDRIVLVKDMESDIVECTIMVPHNTDIDELKNKLHNAVEEYYENHKGENIGYGDFYFALSCDEKYDDLLPYNSKIIYGDPVEIIV